MEKEPDIEKIESEMKKAWRDRPTAPVPDEWMDRVMDSVHNAADHQSPLLSIVKKCALLAASAVILFLILIPKDMLSTDKSLVQLIMQDPAGFLNNLPLAF